MTKEEQLREMVRRAVAFSEPKDVLVDKSVEDAQRIEELEAKLADAKSAAYEKGLDDALALIVSLGYGRNQDVDEGHEEAYRAIEFHLKHWKAAADALLAEIKEKNQ